MPAFVAGLLFCLVHAVCARQVHWYLASGNTEGNAAFLSAHPSAITGAYLCCNWATFLPNGSFTSNGVSNMLSQMSVITDTNRDAWIVIGVSQQAIYSGSWKNGMAGAAATAKEIVQANALFQGWIVDYEPDSNYSMQHAEAYGNFLGALAAAIKPVGAALAMDIAGWGVLNVDFWPAFLNRGIARFTSMTPTYDGSNITENEVFVREALSRLPPGTYAAGLSSQVSDPTAKCAEGDSHWNSTNMPAFVQWMAQEGVDFVDVWRSDIDCPYDKNGQADSTEDWFLTAVEEFLV